MSSNCSGLIHLKEIDRLRNEKEALVSLLNDVLNVRIMSGGPLLAVPPELLEGYLAFEKEERRYTAFALSKHAPFVVVWYRYLALFRKATYSVEEPEDSQTAPLSHLLSLQFIAVAGGTAKLVLDASLAGYYTQALALVRHLFETWLRLFYLEHFPDAAFRWYTDEHGQSPRPPNDNTIRKQVRSAADKPEKALIEQVIGTIDRLNPMAHPSHHTLQQTVGARPDQYNIGANYDPDLALTTLHEGGSAVRLILASLSGLVSQSRDWKDEYRSAFADHQGVIASEAAIREARGHDGEEGMS